MTDSVECAVIGAGVVGLAVARELARAGLETVVLETEQHIGTGTSSRNSEVIHAGIYYEPESLKAKLCVRGNALLYDYCDAHGIDNRRCGKLIVATSKTQIARLHEISERALRSGVTDLQFLDGDAARNVEPNLECVAAIISPSTGIVDSHNFMLSLQGDLEAAGGMIGFESPVECGTVEADGIVLRIGSGLDTAIKARFVVNAAGLDAHRVAASIVGLPPESIPPIHYAKGNYYSLTGHAPFSRLVYPVPERGGLGIHLTLDLGGQARFGPDVEWVESRNYDVDAQRADHFYSEIRRYWPALQDDSLRPAYSGIRPKLHGPEESAADFMLQGPVQHGVRGLVNLYGIESPGLTASLAIAEQVSSLLHSSEITT